MTITVPDVVAERGKADAKRHREKQREAIRKQLPDVISGEAIITKRSKGKTVRIPIKEIQIPVFRHGSGKGCVGVGQSKDGKTGDVIGRRPAPGSKPGKNGKPGSEPGVDYIETEMELEELIEMAFEDIGLPRLKDKNVREILVEAGYKIKGTQHSGPYVLMNRRKTAQAGMKRFWALLFALVHETDLDELTCFRAFKQADGIFADALVLLRENKVTDQSNKVEPFVIPHKEDERFFKIEKDTKPHSRAVVFALRDVSGSMWDEKVYFSQIMLFWLVTFLEKLYKQVEVRFIAHDTRAWLLTEEELLRIETTYGGTACASAYRLVDGLIESEYPVSEWNTYVWHFSDGDDFHPDGSVTALRKLLSRGINMFCYSDIRPGEDTDSFLSGLLAAYIEAFNLDEEQEGTLTVHVSNDEKTPFLGIRIRMKDEVLPALKAFLKQDRWEKE